MAHKYEEVAASIRESIAESMAPHDALASERELMAIHGVSRMTVRKAIATLVEEGRVYNVHGSGTYVGSADIFSKTPKLTSFTEDMISRGAVPSSRVLELARIEAPESIAAALGLAPSEETTHIRRLRLADDVPIAIEDVYVPRLVLDLESLNLGASLYEQLRLAGHEVFRAEQEIKAITLTAQESRLLEVAKGEAALSVTRVSSSRRGHLIEFARTIYRADRYTFQLAVTRDDK
ncbi:MULTISPECIES: GntR family transcriptional regulator [unclassified Microbacterium]|uniref:GntR family transcriptional regulator n=1 Tax=unclassified Microbacterium TaxID=2609290 RepID=UPI000D514C22|nr:GntR family transcriptional regulator [Microbacterium sp. TPD7012]PVE94694.1 GntR family transcriptional regulator [Microbacterium sp. TPD7012]